MSEQLMLHSSSRLANEGEYYRTSRRYATKIGRFGLPAGERHEVSETISFSTDTLLDRPNTRELALTATGIKLLVYPAYVPSLWESAYSKTRRTLRAKIFAVYDRCDARSFSLTSVMSEGESLDINGTESLSEFTFGDLSLKSHLSVEDLAAHMKEKTADSVVREEML